ncbi:Radical SAM domain protein [Candidatus Zixiibacteriota bacterium]|nr:Radical SAM domain protein [candidate division Zixibacteria bacterium]
MKNRPPEEIIALGQELYDSLSECQICPQDCGVNRRAGQLGKCRSGAELKVASFNIHLGEEPPLSGGNGSGTIFLANCSLFCRYCQNYPISQFGNGRTVTIEELKGMMLDLQRRGADNINFVTPDHMLPMILMAVGMARQEGMDLPLVYNCSGYQKLEILRLLEGIIDIYLVDMRYDDNDIAHQYSGCHNYVEINRAAVREMYRQVGNLKFDRRRIARSGAIVRHLVLPENLSGSAGIFKFLAEEVSPNVHVSLMSQYFPAYKALQDDRISRRITPEEFRAAVEAFYEAGMRHGYIQEMEYEAV